MAGGNQDDDSNSALEEPEGMNFQPKSSHPMKTVFIFLNIIIWLGSSAILGLGIFSIVDKLFTRSVLGENSLNVGASVLIIVGSTGFLIAFIGCCGLLTGNKGLIMSYMIVLVFLLITLLAGGILGALFTNHFQNAAVEAMRNSLQKYDKDDDKSPIVRSWDAMQRSLKCCGVLLYKDWKTLNSDFKGVQKIPVSCCVLDSERKPEGGCTNATKTRDFYSSNTDGCHSKLIEELKKYTPIVASVAAVVTFFMIFGLIVAIIIYTRL